jgi:hypothetical protein
VGRYDTRVPEFFEFGIQTINRDVNDWARVYADRHNYDTVVKVMEGYAAALATKNPKKAAWYKSYHAAAAWRTGKLDEAKKVLNEQGEAADPRPFQRMGSSDGKVAISQVYAYSGPHAAAVRQADAARQNGDDATAAKAYAAVLEKLDEKDPARRYVSARSRAADAVVKLAAGEWVDVQPVDGLAGWRQVTGTWQVDADGALVGRPHIGGAADRQKVLAWTGAVFGEDEAFEIAGHFEFVGEPDAKVGAAGALIVADDFGARGFVILDRDKAKAVFYFGTNPPMAETEVGAGNDFLVRYDHKTFTLEANGKPVGRPFTMTGEKFAGGLYAGVGGVGTAPVKFTKLKLRRVVKPEANEK